MRRSAVEIEVGPSFHVLAVIAFAAGQTKQALLENCIAAVPQGQGEADALVAIADSCEAILIPSVGPGSRLIVRKVVPCGATGAVVLENRPPGSLAQIRSPAFPVLYPAAGLIQARGFRRDVHDIRWMPNLSARFHANYANVMGPETTRDGASSKRA